jgi:dCTP deaminase
MKNGKRCMFCQEKLEPAVSRCRSCGLLQTPRTLVDWEIKELINRKIIVIEPVLNLEEQLNPGGLDLRLDTRLREFRFSERESINPLETVREYEYYVYRELEHSKRESYILHPKEFVLAQSFEYIALPDFILAGLDGRSSFGRLGVVIHATAGSIDPGFHGHVTFELSNLAKMPIKLEPLTRIARLMFHVTERCKKPYSGSYQFQSKVKASKSYLGNN